MAGTLVVGGIGVLCCLLPLELLLVLSGTGLVAIYAGIALAAIVGRRTGATDHALYRMPLYPLAPIVTLVALDVCDVDKLARSERGSAGADHDRLRRSSGRRSITGLCCAAAARGRCIRDDRAERL